MLTILEMFDAECVRQQFMRYARLAAVPLDFSKN